MNHAREIKVGILAAVCLFLLFFGFNFLKGVNIFSPTNSYHGTFYNLHGLEEQAAVNILGHKVGQVDKISYDFTRDSVSLTGHGHQLIAELLEVFSIKFVNVVKSSLVHIVVCFGLQYKYNTLFLFRKIYLRFQEDLAKALLNSAHSLQV